MINASTPLMVAMVAALFMRQPTSRLQSAGILGLDREGRGVSIVAEQGSQRHRTHTQTPLQKEVAARN